MNKIAAIRYIDAFYFFEGEGLKYTTPKTQVAIGSLRVRNDCITLSFAEKNGIPDRGLFMRKQALILGGKSKLKKLNGRKLFKKSIDSDVGIFWEDIVYFENGEVPARPTTMYTEGIFFKITSEAIIIKYPETIKIEGKFIDHHPKHPDGKLMFFVIPRSFITSIEFYDKKI